MANILETLMIVSFGCSWPLSIVRSYRSRSTKGKSPYFSFLILFGYFCGLAAKIMTHTFNLAFYFYIPNIIMVSIDTVLWFRNRKIERSQES